MKFYNATAANTTVGTTVPVITLAIEADSGEVWSVTQGLLFSTAITAAATTGIADNDTGAPGANDIVLTVGYA